VTSASIYLDNNSTTPIDPGVMEAMVQAWQDSGANPASQHAPGRKARRLIEEAREAIAALLGAKTSGMDADQLIFTSGGTEANNLALFGLTSLSAGTKPSPGAPECSSNNVFVSPIEHPSILAAAEELKRRGCQIHFASVGTNGIVSIETGRQECLPHFALASVMLANNETGVIQPIAKIAQQCREHGITIHTDAVQAVGKIPVHFRDLGVDALTVAPHKFHGPIGIGALLLRHGTKLQPQLHGGFQQSGLRPGTENVALAVGFQKALELALAELPSRHKHTQSLQGELERALRAEFPDLIIIGEHAPRLPNTSCLAFPGLNRQALVMALDLAGLACSTGSACASGSSEPSTTLLAMNLPQAVIEGAIRLSTSALTTAADIATATRLIINSVKHLRSAK
jgi:cysteine desulfurase